MVEVAGANKESGGRFAPLKMRPVRQWAAFGTAASENVSGGQVLLLARHASENASGSAGGCPQSVESAVLRAVENAFGVTGCRLAHL